MRRGRCLCLPCTGFSGGHCSGTNWLRRGCIQYILFGIFSMSERTRNAPQRCIGCHQWRVGRYRQSHRQQAGRARLPDRSDRSLGARAINGWGRCKLPAFRQTWCWPTMRCLPTRRCCIAVWSPRSSSPAVTKLRLVGTGRQAQCHAEPRAHAAAAARRAQ